MTRQEWLQAVGVLNTGSWCPLVFAFLPLGSSQAILLGVLIGQMAAEIEAEKDEDLWMRMPTKRILGKLKFWSERKVKRVLYSIRDLLEVKTVGRPKSRQRWIRLRVDRLNEVVQSHRVKCDPGVKCDPLPGVKCDPVRIDELQDRPSRSTASSPREMVQVKSMRAAPYREFAQRLHDMVQTVRKVSSSSRPSTWAQSFRTLHRRGVPIEKIEEALSWYKSTLKKYGDLMRAGTTYVPIAYSGPKWLDKWDSIEAAMERDRAKEGGGEGKKLNVRLRIVKRSTREVDEWGFDK